MIIQLCDWKHRDLTSKIETDIKIEKLRLILAYLQLLKSQLPCFTYTEKTLIPEDVASLLVKFYGCKTVTGIIKFDEAINVDFDVKDVLQLETSFTPIAKVGIRHAILALLKNEIEQKLADPFILATEELCTLLNQDIEKLDYLLETGKLPVEWKPETSKKKHSPNPLFNKDQPDVPDFDIWNTPFPYSFNPVAVEHCVNINHADEITFQPGVKEWVEKTAAEIIRETGELPEVELTPYRYEKVSFLEVCFSNTDTKNQKVFPIYFYAANESAQFNIEDSDSVLVSDMIDALQITRLLVEKLTKDSGQKLSIQFNAH